MKKTLMLATSVLFGAVLMGCQNEPAAQQEQVQAQQTITGNVAYRERIMLPDNAVVTVRLQDVSLMDAPAKLISEQVIETNGAQVPVAFELSYNPNDIKPGHRYSVSARIEVAGELRFITDTMNAVITDENQTQQLNLMLVGTR
ncbi:YbaY family lipoprotein [Vibrio scophthalmi]|uniref:Putative lipoprotein YbaY n=1 Tax=Vibrio scophthalmi TaxID=45658 RepID=A0A1C7FBU5_9VIBR|nr:YbaY family lipoprotein [Vibrio scophthalmi]ANU36824.1 putative lipoprotein YbaY [Vibrio scophthalmi]MCY9801984.1 YbaY family lipoprotein [Vibrio scophthalmi]ODS11770.1 putative lipoprotein YbaY [Vibrio scophthalmi]